MDRMAPIVFVGWIEKILEPSKYSVRFVVRSWRNKKEQSKLIAAKAYNSCLLFEASISSGAASQLDGLNVNDKVQVQFLVTGATGTSADGKFYCMNRLKVLAYNGIMLLERGTGV